MPDGDRASRSTLRAALIFLVEMSHAYNWPMPAELQDIRYTLGITHYPSAGVNLILISCGQTNHCLCNSHSLIGSSSSIYALISPLSRSPSTQECLGLIHLHHTFQKPSQQPCTSRLMQLVSRYKPYFHLQTPYLHPSFL
jgi:hypothetical protein